MSKISIKLFLITLLSITSLFSQTFTPEWDIEKTDDAKFTIKSNISERIDENGEEVQLIEYIAETIADVNSKRIIAVLKDVSVHKEFSDETEVSKVVKHVSENEWIIYYFYNAPWPVPNSDSVQRMTINKDSLTNTTIVKFVADASLYEETDVDRIKYHIGTYTIQDIGEDKIKLISTARFSPSFSVPGWLIRGWFPDGPADELKTIIRLAKSDKYAVEN